MKPRRYRQPLERTAAAVVTRAVVLAAIWWVLTEGVAAPVAAGVFVPLALLASFTLAPAHRRKLRIAGLLRFIPLFLWESLRGGIDVARRALHPRMPLAPSVFEYPLRLSDPRERVLLAGVLSLVPGTASAELAGDRIRLHVLDVRLPIERTVRRAEGWVAALFGDVPEAQSDRRRQGR